MKNGLRVLYFFLFVFGFSVNAASLAEKGYDIARKVKEQDLGFKGTIAQAEMILTNAAGKESRRNLDINTFEVNGDGDKSIIVFKSPRDIENTKLLTWSHILDSDEQWLYLPSLKRTKRISSRNKSGPFVGSEFAYEDLSSQEVDKYSYEYIGEESLNGTAHWVIQRVPIYSNSGYSKQVVWVDQDKLIFSQIDFFDKKKQLLKTLVFDDYQLYLDTYWRPHTLTMSNKQNSKVTVMQWQEYTFTSQLSEQDFQPAVLRR
ncbi:outer membrane lipoprotein-sorting protein [Photobacterium lutimaris]|uniref:Outer membrane lipoprotein-sorting protein n=1 Tax=Photobacterium lutimaris TaxID=388278 RepID=A0A2T3IUW8_9GAMM|nr:outer membrane lipoprotein-sorting protein [Photobacterium lutimaris]PSU32183.1 outer membrane lipoprotein-sorting protein [Photobacterium lutimaris]TDR70522.1 outer membrane lipoprotein-sorting protein [Photobacterium lutimaris]